MAKAQGARTSVSGVITAGAGALLCFGCSASSEPGVRVALVSEQRSPPGQAVAPGADRLELEEARWTISEVELEPCASASAALRSWLIRDAFAHGTESPTLMATPTVVNAMASGAVPLGELAPPAGRYCRARYHVSPADADALGLSEAPSMLGVSLLVRGTFVGTDGEDGELAVSTQQAFDVNLDLELELSPAQPEASLHFWSDPQRWLSGMRFRDLSAEETEAAFLEAFRSSFGVDVK